MITILLFISVISLLGTLIGAAVGLLISKPSNKFIAAMLGFSSGIMLSIVVFELIPECIEKWNFKNTLFAAIFGIIIIAFLDEFLSKKKLIKNKHLQLAILTAAALMLHNFPEGIIMGCGFLAETALGFKMCILIMIHDIPEGIAVSTPMVASKVDRLKAFAYTAITALPTALGAAVGLLIGNISQSTVGLNLGIASGIMLYIVCGKMLPEANEFCNEITTTFAILLGILIGLAMCTLL